MDYGFLLIMLLICHKLNFPTMRICVICSQKICWLIHCFINRKKIKHNYFLLKIPPLFFNSATHNNKMSCVAELKNRDGFAGFYLLLKKDCMRFFTESSPETFIAFSGTAEGSSFEGIIWTLSMNLVV